MAASGDPYELLAPKGELEPALFPLLTVQALASLIAAWLDEGYTRATDAGITDTTKADRAAEAFAYWRAFDSALQRIIASPTTASFVDKGSSTYSSEQLRILAGKVGQWQAQYQTLISPDEVETSVSKYPSGASPTTFRF